MNNPLLDSLAKAPPPPSELDELMQRDPLDLSSQDIDSIIAYQRAARARREAGGRTRKAGAETTSGIDLVSLVKGTGPTPKPTITPPAAGGFRRL